MSRRTPRELRLENELLREELATIAADYPEVFEEDEEDWEDGDWDDDDFGEDELVE